MGDCVGDAVVEDELVSEGVAVVELVSAEDADGEGEGSVRSV